MLCVGEAFGAGGGGVGVDAVAAAVGGGYGDVDQLLDQGVQSAGGHDRFDAFPGALEDFGLVGERAPEIVYEIGLAGGADVGKDGADPGVGGDLFVGP